MFLLIKLNFKYNGSDESEDVIQRIALQVWSELKNTPEYVVKLAVGLDSRVDKVIETLDLRSQGVRFLGIHGTPGIGKTTLAKAVFNKLVVKFKHRCYVSNVREQLCTKEGLMGVQDKLISDLSLKTMLPVKEDNVVNRQKIKMIINVNRVLVVLDDVSEAGQLEKLGIVREWFVDESRIIVTSRNVNVLHDFALNDRELYEAEELDPGESLELFSIHALGRTDPTQEFRDVSERIVSLTGGLPLALEVFGSSLVKKTKKEWEDALMKLKTFRPSNLQQVLKFSYDGLDDQEKTVFLDLSCLLIQMNLKREDVVDILEGCGLRAELAIGNLVTKSLLKITKDKELWMHDQIRDMGRQIVIEESFQDTGERSRLWDYEEIMHVLRHENVTDAVRGIVLDIEKPPLCSLVIKSYWNNFKRNPGISTFVRYVKEKFKGLLSQHLTDEDQKPALQTIWFKKMVHLKLLQINYANLQGNFKYMSSELRWLQWKGCSQKTFPATMPEQIRVLDLSESRIEHLWYSDQACWGFNFNKVVGNLVVINLYGCPCLKALPDMSGHRHLKKLTLELCMGLTKIHESIGNMSSLVHLNLRRCSNLVDFPRDVTGMKGLRELLLSECRKFTGLPHDVRSMTSLIQLHLDNTAISELPEYLFHLSQLEDLSLQSCYQITRLPEEIGSLISLKKFSLSHTNLKELPVSIGSMTSLEELSLYSCSSLTALPESVGRLKSLTELHLNSTSIQELPSSICALSCLKVLSLEMCHSLVKLPDSVAGLASIVDLKLTNTPIKSLPDDIGCLKFIEKLEMTGCSFLEKLPESIGKMSNLTRLTVAGADLIQLPESIGELENLTWLNLNNCQKLCSLPESIGSLGSLCVFMMEETAVTCLPESFGLLGDLRVLKMKKSSNKLARLSELPASFCKLSNLEEFDARTCGICGQISNDFNKLSKLEILNLGYNDFHSLPVTLEGLSALQKLLLRNCTELRSLPQLPSTLVELNAADCYELMCISDLSNLERLQEIQLANCNKVIDVPGLECLKSLRRLFMGGCNKAIKSAVRRRLRKATLRNLNNLSVPGSEIPDWFSQAAVTFAAHPNLAIKNVIVALVVSVDPRVLDEIRVHQYPGITDIQACIFRLGEPIFRTTLYLMGVPRTQEDQLYMCRFKAYNPLVSLLKGGDIIKGEWRRGTVTGIEIKRWGIHLVFENDDDFDGDEDSLSVVKSHQSVSQRLLNFFRSMDQ
ncbi:disease resistance protein TAO1-like isoform X2 [Chenopodium quinoa]|uniref:disease resistance protein TAO1-like isoform X2 n=1 Tax=Chenopodium quinoa TaxID=63459 RepID=UPI000B77D9CF|nr:disease resistance protein TAO1-like isoform X2 [Chenopodium quinoa]XP_021747986.1 disease resistance protein TAO1-like isoform X2 [Chenopodium quinoa]